MQERPKKKRKGTMFVQHYDYSVVADEELEQTAVDVDRNVLKKFLKPYFWRKEPIIYKEPATEWIIRKLNVDVLTTPSEEHYVTLLHNMAELLRTQTESIGYIIYLRDFTENEIFICPNKKEKFYQERYSWSLKTGRTVATYAINLEKTLIVDTTKTNINFPYFQGIPELDATDILISPIMNKHNLCIGALELYRTNGNKYENEHIIRVQFLLKSVGKAMTLTRERAVAGKFIEIDDYLVHNISHTLSLEYTKQHDYLLYKIANMAKKTLDAESCTIFLMKRDELVLELTTDNDLIGDLNKKKLREEQELEIAMYASKISDDCICFSDVQSDERFDNEVNFTTLKIIRNVLAAPIYGRNRHVLGVIQLINTLDEKSFTDIDREFIVKFSTYCSMWLYYRKKCDYSIEQDLLNTVLQGLIYNQLDVVEDAETQFNINDELFVPENFNDYAYNPLFYEIAKIPKYIFYILKTMTPKILTNATHYQYLYNFIFMIKKLYHTKKFYNIESGFLAMHLVYCIIKNNQTVFENLEIFALLISALCVHIDSCGETPAFLHITKNPIMEIYDNHGKECHQVWLVQLIIEDSHLIQHLPESDQEKILKFIEENMIALNYRVYFRNLSELRSILAIKTLNIVEMKSFENYLIRSMVMNAGRLAPFSKSFRTAYKLIFDMIEDLNDPGEVDDELFNIYVEKFGFGEDDNVNKLHCDLAQLFGIPCFEVMKQVFPNTTKIYSNCVNIMKSRQED